MTHPPSRARLLWLQVIEFLREKFHYLFMVCCHILKEMNKGEGIINQCILMKTMPIVIHKCILAFLLIIENT